MHKLNDHQGNPQVHKLQRTHLRLKVNIEVARLQQDVNEPSVLVVVWDISFRNSRDNENLEHIADSECNYATTQLRNYATTQLRNNLRVPVNSLLGSRGLIDCLLLTLT